jgi:uncharacterized protein YukE
VRSTALGATLATCAEPTVLVPGSPAALRADADDLDQRARALAQHGVETRDASAASWTGAAADGWAGRREQYAQTLDAVSQVHATSASTLRLHADAVEWGQSRAQVAIDFYARGCELRDRELGSAGALLASGPTRNATDPGAQHRAAAEDVLASAQQQVLASARAAAEVLDQLSEGLPDGRWHLGDFTEGIWSWVTGMTSLVWKFNSVRALVDSRGLAHDAAALVDGSIDTYQAFIDDPIGTSRSMAELDLLRDRPAQWWGQLSPDIALAAVGGAGLAAKALRGVAVAEEVAFAAEDVADATRRLYQAGSRWESPAERARWLDDYTRGPVESNPNLRTIPLNAPEDFFQLGQTGPVETLIKGSGKEAWADGLTLDPDAVAAVEIKFSGTPGRSPYTGTAPSFVTDPVMVKFDDQISRYAAVVADDGNPVARLRMVTNEQAVADFLGERARAILGPDVDFQVVVRPE